MPEFVAWLTEFVALAGITGTVGGERAADMVWYGLFINSSYNVSMQDMLIAASASDVNKMRLDLGDEVVGNDVGVGNELYPNPISGKELLI